MKKNIFALLIIFALLLIVACSSEENSAPVPEFTGAGDAEKGAELFKMPVIAGGQTGCRNCHALEADVRLVGPSLDGLVTRTNERLDDGVSAEAYFKASITSPAAYLVEGYPNVMPPTYTEALSAEEMADIVAFLLTLE